MHNSQAHTLVVCTKKQKLIAEAQEVDIGPPTDQLFGKSILGNILIITTLVLYSNIKGSMGLFSIDIFQLKKQKHPLQNARI